MDDSIAVVAAKIGKHGGRSQLGDVERSISADESIAVRRTRGALPWLEKAN
jgi:hypothetical protein